MAGVSAGLEAWACLAGRLRFDRQADLRSDTIEFIVDVDFIEEASFSEGVGVLRCDVDIIAVVGRFGVSYKSLSC